MAGDVVKLKWAEQEARHPELLALLELPFDELLRQSAASLLDEPEGSDQDPGGNWTANGIQLRFAENDHAKESILILRTKWSTAAVYQSEFKGVIGKVIEPVPSWGISIDKDGGRYYWSESLHGDTPGMFVCGLSEVEELPENDLATPLLRLYLGLAIYSREHPEVVAEFGHSGIAPLDLKARLGLTE